MATFLSKSLRQPKHQQLDFIRRKGVFYGQVVRMTNSSVRRRGFPDKRVVVSSRQIRTVVSRTDADCGFTDKHGLRFTDRRSSDFPDTCHLDFPDTRYLNFPDASQLTKQPKSGITNSAQKTSAAEKCSNLQTSWRFVVKNMLGRKWEQGIHIILRQSQYTADLTIGRTEIIVQFLGKVKFLWTCQVM